MPALKFFVAFIGAFVLMDLSARRADAVPATQPVSFNTNFEGGSIGQIEPLSDASFRFHIEGQTDELGHNRQGSWFFFRMDHVRGKDLTVVLAYFHGEYNGKPATTSMGPGLNPVYSDDGIHWRHFSAMEWNEETSEATLHVQAKNDSIWLAHIQPYTLANVGQLLADVDRCPDVRVEVIGKSVRGRELDLVTATNPEIPESAKKVVWLMTRQHAWEAGTSWAMDGALRFVASDVPEARELRDKVVFVFSPMVDPDGCAGGKVRFNANSYDVNRHWDEVDLEHKELLKLMPEIWYHKKAILSQMAHREGRGIDLMVNIHNTETGEYIDTQVTDEPTLSKIRALDAMLTAGPQYDPSSKVQLRQIPSDTTNSLWKEAKVPVALMELRIGTGKKLGREPTAEDRAAFGQELIQAMAHTVTPKE